MEDPGDDRLSRLGHYHGPGGLNGRVRDGNGCGPAGMVAGKPGGGRVSGRPADALQSGVRANRCVRKGRARDLSASPASSCGGGPDHLGHGRSRIEGSIASLARGHSPSFHAAGPGSPRAPSGGACAAAGRGGQAAWLLGPVGCGGRPPCTPGLSTWSSSRSLRSYRCWKPGLGGGFALRCLQRLSGPDLATRRCPERDSRYTRGRSSPILSY